MRSEVPFTLKESRWESTTLAELCARGGGDVQTGPFGTQLHAGDYVDDGVPVIMPQDLLDGRIDTTDIARISEDDAKRLSRYRVREGDIVYSRRGDIRRRALVGSTQDGWLCGTGCLRIRVGDGARSDYIAAYLGHPAVQAWIERHAVGATMLNLNTKILSAVPITLPDRDEQERIVSMLTALDDKIDSNRRLASFLEQTAAAIFKARFVDFVGVEEFDESEIGRVPRGWSIKSLAELVEQRRESGTDNRPYIGLDDMPRGSTVLESWKSEGAPSGQSNRFERGDILFGKLRPYFRKVGVAPIGGRCSTEIVVLGPRAPGLFGLSIGHLTSSRFFDHCEAVSTGTRMPRAEWKLAGQLRVALPGPDILMGFNDCVTSVYEQIAGLTHESRTLATLRDTLLPKLISGEMRVTGTDDREEVIDSTAEQPVGAALDE